jgi:hypothetical protein
MKQRRRIYYSETQKALMWERWQKGESLRRVGPLGADRRYGQGPPQSVGPPRDGPCCAQKKPH